MGKGENLAPSFWLACANLIKNAKINYGDFAENCGKFRVLNSDI